MAKDHKIDIHAKDEHGWNLLFFAAENSNKKLMRWLLRMHADACAESAEKLTPLMPLAFLVARMAPTAELRHTAAYCGILRHAT